MSISAISGQLGQIDLSMFTGRAKQMPGAGFDATQFAADMIENLDEDGDGALSLEEMGGDEDLLTMLDSDEDGLVSQAELEEAPPPPPPPPPNVSDFASKLIEGLDEDGDGALSLEEIGDNERLAELDSDGDGLVTQEELEAAPPPPPPPPGMPMGAPVAADESDSVSVLLEALNQNQGMSSYLQGNMWAALFGNGSGSASVLNSMA